MTHFEKKRILITGHKGFIGNNLYNFLNTGEYELIGLDIVDDNDLLVCKLPDNIDCVIHLAGVGGVRASLEYPAYYWKNNVEVTRRIIQTYNNTRILVASSSSQYEPHLNPYAASKHVIEYMKHTNICFMRFHTVYSENPRKDMFFDKLLNGGLKYITNHERDFIHVSDICSAIKLIMSLDIKGSLDVGTGISSKIHCMVRSLPLKISSRERKKTKANTKLLRSLGFKCSIDLETFLIDNWDRITKSNPGLF